MLRARILTGALIVGIIALLGYLASQSPSAAVAKPAPDIPLQLKPNEPPTQLSQLKGKVVILDFWATWCGPCRMTIPELAGIYKKYKDQGLEIVGISVDEKDTRDMVPIAIKKLGINYPVVYGDDIEGLRTNYAVKNLPTLYLVSRKGDLVGKIEGYDPSGRLRMYVEDLLREKP